MNEYDLERFLSAQKESYEAALSEIKNGRKRTHWIWYIFPQLKDLGHSYKAQFYGIEDIDEAKSYLAHPVLGTRLREISEALLQLNEDDPSRIMNGHPDDLKLHSCMTLFACISDSDSVFHKVIKKFFAGQMDYHTLNLLKKSESNLT